MSHAKALDRRRATQPGGADRAHAEDVSPVPHPVAQRRVTAAVGAMIALAFEAPGPGRRVEVKAGADVSVAGAAGPPEALREDEDRAGSLEGPAGTVVPSPTRGGRERVGRGEDAAIAADEST